MRPLELRLLTDSCLEPRRTIMSIVDFLIHLKPDLPLNERARLEAELGDMDGVMSAHFSSNHPHVMEVAYDPDVVTAQVLMGHIGEHGIEAHKIGL
jgi:hypothetical protein